MEKQKGEKKPLAWGSITLIPAVHVIGVLGILYVIFMHFSWPTIKLSLVWFFLCGFSITAGYHRLFTHRSYKCRWIIRATLLFFGAASVQGSIFQWVSNHKLHHAADTKGGEGDPHSIHKGFWYAHCLWLIYKMPVIKNKYVRVLSRDGLAVFQRNHYVALMVFFGFVLPMYLGRLWGDALGALLLAGFLRTAVQWHITWSVNSVAHKIGDNLFRRPDESRNNWCLSALMIALGELFHNLHHQFPRDYRNGWKWYHVDPTKWLIWTWSVTGLAWDLHRTPKKKILEAIKAAKSRPMPA